MKVEFLDQAREEFLEVVATYEAEQPGLGQRFKDEVDKSIRWLIAIPEVLRIRSGGYRRKNLPAFRYYIPYILRGDTIWNPRDRPFLPPPRVLDHAEEER